MKVGETKTREEEPGARLTQPIVRRENGVRKLCSEHSAALRPHWSGGGGHRRSHSDPGPSRRPRFCLAPGLGPARRADCG